MNRRRKQALLFGCALAALFAAGVAVMALNGCGPDLPAAELAKTSDDTLVCVQRVEAVMRTALDCSSRVAAADLVAQTDPHCIRAKLTDLGLHCPRDGGVQ